MSFVLVKVVFNKIITSICNSTKTFQFSCVRKLIQDLAANTSALFKLRRSNTDTMLQCLHVANIHVHFNLFILWNFLYSENKKFCNHRLYTGRKFKRWQTQRVEVRKCQFFIKGWVLRQNIRKCPLSICGCDPSDGKLQVSLKHESNHPLLDQPACQ